MAPVHPMKSQALWLSAVGAMQAALLRWLAVGTGLRQNDSTRKWVPLGRGCS